MISLTDYLFKSVASGGTIALNGRVASTAMVLELREKCAVNDITLRTDLRLVDELWTEDRPALPSGMAFAYPEDYAGRRSARSCSWYGKRWKNCVWTIM